MSRPRSPYEDTTYGGEVFPLDHTFQELFILIVLLLCLQNTVDELGDIRFCSYVLHSDINDDVSLVLPLMANMNIPSEDLLVIYYWVDSDFFWLTFPWG